MGTVLALLGNLCRKREHSFPSELRALIGIYVIGQEWLIYRQRGILFRITKADLEEKEFKWGYSSSKGYYIGYKLTLVIEYPSLMPVAFLLHQGSPSDAKLYEDILEELKRRRIARNGDTIIFDKGYYGYKNYALCYGDFQIQGYKGLVKSLKAKLENWKKYKPIRGMIEDIFKLAKNAFSLENLHRYTKRSVKKFVCLHVLLVGIVVSLGINSKEELQKIAEW